MRTTSWQNFIDMTQGAGKLGDRGSWFIPTVGECLMFGSENNEQAGQTRLEAKMQTEKINQGNIVLKRVVESIAIDDSHVPFRDSKLTKLLQDSIKDDKSNFLMILCASPDPKEIHKTMSDLHLNMEQKQNV